MTNKPQNLAHLDNETRKARMKEQSRRSHKVHARMLKALKAAAPAWYADLYEKATAEVTAEFGPLPGDATPPPSVEEQLAAVQAELAALRSAHQGSAA